MSVLLQNSEMDCQEATFSPEDHAMWQKLYRKQSLRLNNLATPAFFSNLQQFNLPQNRVPTLSEISERLFEATGWQVTPVTGLLDYNSYFFLLQKRLFPTAMFMRKISEENLCKDPDLFHEVFGHCTMLLSKNYADFMQKFAEFALGVKTEDRLLFARLIWFGTETALIKLENKLHIFGSSILSSYEESDYAINEPNVIRKPFDIINIFREPYRADILQKVYYVLENEQQLYQLINDIPALYRALDTARQLGEAKVLFEKSDDKYSNIGQCKQLHAVCD